jgi:hypothetical protein
VTRVIPQLTVNNVVLVARDCDANPDGLFVHGTSGRWNGVAFCVYTTLRAELVVHGLLVEVDGETLVVLGRVGAVGDEFRKAKASHFFQHSNSRDWVEKEPLRGLGGRTPQWL